MEKEKRNKIEELIFETMENLKGMADTDTIIGNPVKTPLGIVIPVSKVTVGFLSGGGEYGEIKYYKKDEEFPFSGGSGGIVSVKPLGFLIDNGLGCKVVPMGGDLYDKIFSACETFINSLKKDD